MILTTISCKESVEEKQVLNDNGCPELSVSYVPQPIALLGDSIYLGDSISRLASAGIISRLDPMTCDVQNVEGCDGFSCYIWSAESIPALDDQINPLYSYTFYHKRLIRVGLSLTFDGNAPKDSARKALKNLYMDKYWSSILLRGCYKEFDLDTSTSGYFTHLSLSVSYET